MLKRLLIVLAIALPGCQVVDALGIPSPLLKPGVLAGHVSIGPLTPVERVGVPTPTVPPEVYAARQVIIYHADGQKEVTRLKLDANGNYTVTLAPGQYVVNMARSGPGGPRNLPATVTITSNLTTTLDISVDTGIR